MLFGTRAPLWKYILGIFTLTAGAQRVAAAVILGSGGPPGWLAVGVGLQALAAVVLAIGLFADANRFVRAGAIVAGVGIVVSLAGGVGAGQTGYGLRALGGGALLIMFAGLALGFERFARGYDAPRVDDNRPVLTAAQAENFAANKPELFGGEGPGDVSVSAGDDGRWSVRMRERRHEVPPMTEPEWQRWLKQHGTPGAPHAS